MKYFKKDLVHELLRLLKSIGVSYEIGDVPSVCRDSKDDFLLALALESKSHYLVTGDQDLLVFKDFANTQIVDLHSFKETLIKL